MQDMHETFVKMSEWKLQITAEVEISFSFYVQIDIYRPMNSAGN